MVSRQRDIGAFLKAEQALAAATLVGSTTATAVNGDTIDRLSYDDLLLSGKVCIQYDLTNFSTGETVTFLSNLQDSPTSTAWTDFLDRDDSTGVSLTVTQASTGVTTASGVFAYDADFSNAERYVRVQFNHQFGSTAADATYGGQLIFGGSDFNPPS
jgi:hypothetical protein